MGAVMNATSEELQAANISVSDERACETLSVQDTIRRYHDSLIRFLRHRLRVKEDAADVAQEAYIRMMQYEGSTKIHSPSSMLFESPSTWHEISDAPKPCVKCAG